MEEEKEEEGVEVIKLVGEKKSRWGRRGGGIGRCLRPQLLHRSTKVEAMGCGEVGRIRFACPENYGFRILIDLDPRIVSRVPLPELLFCRGEAICPIYYLVVP